LANISNAFYSIYNYNTRCLLGLPLKKGGIECLDTPSLYHSPLVTLDIIIAVSSPEPSHKQTHTSQYDKNESILPNFKNRVDNENDYHYHIEYTCSQNINPLIYGGEIDEKHIYAIIDFHCVDGVGLFA